jgi:hypothetical protein
MVTLVALRALVTLHLARLHFRDRLAPETGEGVISAAIAVLVMAFLGLAMWVAFDTLFTTSSERVAEQVNQIGS